MKLSRGLTSLFAFYIRCQSGARGLEWCHLTHAEEGSLDPRRALELPGLVGVAIQVFAPPERNERRPASLETDPRSPGSTSETICTEPYRAPAKTRRGPEGRRDGKERKAPERANGEWSRRWECVGFVGALLLAGRCVHCWQIGVCADVLSDVFFFKTCLVRFISHPGPFFRNLVHDGRYCLSRVLLARAVGPNEMAVWMRM